MTTVSPSADRPLGMGLASVILGSVGAMLFFLPVLGIPLSAAGLVFGIIGLGMAFFGWTSLRWCVAGIVVSATALVVGVIINQSPGGFIAQQVSPLEESVPGELYAPPPAREGS